jgi:hypothetical protein
MKTKLTYTFEKLKVEGKIHTISASEIQKITKRIQQEMDDFEVEHRLAQYTVGY